MPSLRHDELIAACASLPVRAARPTAARAAAVSVVVTVDQHGDSCVLLTQRSHQLRTYPGQFALPGGHVDPGETTCEAALRELEEELGINADDCHVVGQLNDVVTASGTIVTPFVVLLDATTTLKPNPAEVHRVLHVTAAELRVKPIVSGGEDGASINVQWPFRDELLQSPTASIMRQFIDVLDGAA